MTFDIILLTDTPDFPRWNRGYGAHRLASHLRIHGYTVLVIDFSLALTFNYWKEICNYAIGPNTQMIGISTTWMPFRKPFEENHKVNIFPSWSDWGTDMFHTPYPDKSSFTLDLVKGDAKKWFDVAKEINPKIKFVAGGTKIDWYLDLPVDHFVNGQGENQILDYLTQPKRIWPSLISHDTKSNAVDWGWTTSSTFYTKYDQIRSKEILSVETSRGCRFACKYCSFPLIGNKDLASYLKTEDTIFNELLENYEKWGTTRYRIIDDTFNDSEEKIQLINRISKRLPFELNFWAYVRIDMLAQNYSTIPLLMESGLRSCYMGIESFDPKTSKFVGKGMSEEKRKDALNECKRVWGDKVGIRASYIVGLPFESEESIRRQADWFAEEGNPINHGVEYNPLMINPPGVFPNTPMSDIDRNYQKYGYVISDMNKHLFWTKDDGTDINTFERAYTVAVELSQHFNTLKKVRKSAVHDTIMSDKNGISDPVAEYFIPLIAMLKNES